MADEVDVIDPELYSKCRLCMLEKGVFRTLPVVQDKIKFCFDIIVQPNDYLPQLICKSCKTTLDNYADIKKRFQENQKILTEILNPSKDLQELQKEETPVLIPKEESNIKIQKDILPEVNVSRFTEPQSPSPTELKPQNPLITQNSKEKKHKKSLKRKRVAIISDSEEDAPSKQLSINDNVDVHNIEWKSLFFKKYICRFCSHSFRKKRSLHSHMKTHPNVVKIQHQLIKQHCIIQLEKCDSEPNLTGSDDIVALSYNSILQDTGNLKYFVSFQGDPCEFQGQPAKTHFDSDSCSNSSNTTKIPNVKLSEPTKKKIRFDSDSCSNSSITTQIPNVKSSECVNRTQMVNDANSAPDDQCINVDDSSCDSFASSSQTNTVGAEVDINKIVNNLLNKHKKGKNGKTDENDVMLCRKLLSIGRKIMCWQGVPTPGILKYLEKKNLPVSWQSISAQMYQGSKSNYVRISTKVQDKSENDNLNGWQEVKDNEDLLKELPSSEVETAKQPENPEKDCLLTKLLNSNPVANPKQLPKKQQHIVPFNTIQTKSVQPENDEGSVLIDLDDGDSEGMMLPVIMSTESLANKDSEHISKQTDNVAADDNAGSISGNLPRIKCKPVSELMPKTFQTDKTPVGTLPTMTQPINTFSPPVTILSQPNSSLNQETGVIVRHVGGGTQNSINNQPLTSVQFVSTENRSINPSITLWSKPGITSSQPLVQPINNLGQLNTTLPQFPAIAPPIAFPPAPRAAVPQAAAASTAAAAASGNSSVTSAAAAGRGGAVTATAASSNSAGVLLNSVYIPNMKTTHPINYLKNILQMHDLILITEANAVLDDSFVCLVKFKFGVKKMDRSLIFHLLLFAKQNKFCIKLRRMDQGEIPITTLSAYFQYQVIKSFHGPVSDKILNCALKVSQSLHDYAKQFVCLLKSIECKEST